jgi:hypothetical protein
MRTLPRNKPKRDRTARKGILRKNPERAAKEFHYQRALRAERISQVLAGDDWLSVNDILDQIATQKTLAFDSAAKSNLNEEICLEIEADLRGGRFMPQDISGIMLLSEEYSETTLNSREAIKILDTAFAGMAETARRKSVAHFFNDHGWINSPIAIKYFQAKGYNIKPRPRPTQKHILTTAAAETRCRNWLINEMRANIQPPRRKAAYAAEAKAEFQVGPRAFSRAWDGAIQETKRFNWRNSGRPKKS